MEERVWGCWREFVLIIFGSYALLLVLSDGKGVYGMDGGQKNGWERGNRGRELDKEEWDGDGFRLRQLEN